MLACRSRDIRVQVHHFALEEVWQFESGDKLATVKLEATEVVVKEREVTEMVDPGVHPLPPLGAYPAQDTEGVEWCEVVDEVDNVGEGEVVNGRHDGLCRGGRVKVMTRVEV